MAPLSNIPRSSTDDLSPELVRQRLALCEECAEQSLPHINGRPVPAESARNKIENLVGFVQVPLGIAGPLRVNTSVGDREVYVPMATTEGAMVAAYSRGMRVLSESGTARARVIREGLTQNPILVYRDAETACEAERTAQESFQRFQDITRDVSRHGRLRKLRTDVLGRRLLLSLVFTTGDAIGINMAARATDMCVTELMKSTAAQARYVHGQDVEKRANSRASVEGRGRTVICDATIPRDLVNRLIRVEPEALVAIQRSYAVGYMQLGTHNWLVQAANGLAAVMLACGQDVAYLPECATGHLDFDVTAAGDLYASVTLPSLILGTVGGGTGQGTAAECLAVLGCQGDGNANTLAEILGATVLAGDLSLMGAFCSHEFVDAHERLGRNRPTAQQE